MEEEGEEGIETGRAPKLQVFALEVSRLEDPPLILNHRL